MHVVIAGGGFGGVKTALELSKHKKCKITLISDKDHFLYYPALYGTATGHSHLESSVPLSQIFAGVKNVTLVQDTVMHVDPAARLLIGKKQNYPYDNAVLALGAVTSYFGIKGIAEHSFGIKSLKEVMKFKAHLHDELTEDRHMDKNYVIVGAGATGVELSAALTTYLKRIAKAHAVRHGKISINLVEAAERVLPRMSPLASRLVHRRLKKLGVRVMTNQRVEAADEDDIVVNGKSIPSKTVVWTAGVTNNPFFAESKEFFTLAKNGKVEVDEFMRGAPHLYIIGDNAATPFSGLAQTALHDALYVADHLARRMKDQPTKPYRARKPPVVVPVGDNWAVLEWGPIVFSGFVASLVRRVADLIGYHDILPIGQALGVWRAQMVTEETCETCAERDQDQ